MCGTGYTENAHWAKTRTISNLSGTEGRSSTRGPIFDTAAAIFQEKGHASTLLITFSHSV